MATYLNASNLHLSEDLTAFYRDNGYLILRDLFTEKEKARLIAWVMEIKVPGSHPSCGDGGLTVYIWRAQGWPNVPDAHMHYDEIDSSGNRILTLTENFVDHHSELGQLLRGALLAKLVKDLSGEPMVRDFPRKRSSTSLPAAAAFLPTPTRRLISTSLPTTTSLWPWRWSLPRSKTAASRLSLDRIC